MLYKSAAAERILSDCGCESGCYLCISAAIDTAVAEEREGCATAVRLCREDCWHPAAKAALRIAEKVIRSRK